MIPVLVTGGAGYIGSHVCKQLSHEGFLPIVYDNFCRGNRWAVKWGPLVEADLRDQAALAGAMSTYKPAAVVHLAAFAYVGESNTDPGLYYENNVCGTLALLRAMTSNGIRHLVFSSTCAVYGTPHALPITERMAPAPINPYGRTKLMVEMILDDFRSAYGLDATALRYFNAAGADHDGEIGECHEPETHAIPNILRAAAGELPVFELYGTDYDTPDGSAVRDYIHVSDLASAHVAALNRMRLGGGAITVNLGTGQGHSVLQLIATTEKITGRRVSVRNLPRRPGDPPSLFASAELARQQIGFSPRFGSIDQIIGSAWNWYQKGVRRTQGFV
jgi:UDP-arabinose 4-epimerase